MKKILGILLLFLMCSIVVHAQTAEQKAKQELEKRGLDENEVKARLLTKGIDLDNLDPNNPSEILKAEKALNEVIKEIEDEKKTATADVLEDEIKDVAKGSAENIKDAVDEGTSIEEAVAEELTEAQENALPDAVIYGQHVFRNNGIKLYRQSKDIKPPDSYLLGSGDVVNISIWGYSQESLTLEISEDGFIHPRGMPRINLKGVSFGKAKQLLQSRFDNYYRFLPNEFEVTLNFSRTITVNIVGEVYNYGSFTLPALNTAFNALVAAGGPSDIGSVRNIRLMRANGTSKIIDIYEYLLNPSAGSEFYLLENDYIFIPVAKRIINVQGAVNRPYKYELTNKETLKDLIKYAGGFKENAYQANIQIKRFIDDKEVIKDVDYREIANGSLNFKLLNGDVVVINTIPKPYKNFVEIKGAIEVSGKFEHFEGMRLSNLLKKGVLSEDARKDVSYLLRTNSDSTTTYLKVDINAIEKGKNSEADFFLKPKDRLMVYSQSKFVDRANFSISGAVRNPSQHPFDINENIRFSDAIIMAGGLRNDATDFAYIHRADTVLNNKKKEYVRVDIKKALDNPESFANINLKPSDKIVVFSKTTFMDEINVRVEGAVRNPGSYRYDESLTLRDIVTMAGGLKLQASFSRIDVFRLEFNDDEETETIVATLELDEDFNVVGGDPNFRLAPFDQIIVRNKPEFELQRSVTINGEVKYTGTYALIGDNETITSLIDRAGGFTNEAFKEGITLFRNQDDVGFVLQDINKALKNKNSNFNYILKEGDIITIPKQKDLVSIFGETKIKELYPSEIASSGKINVAYQKGKNAKYYVDKYVGVGEKGMRKLITVEQPSGRIDRTRNYILFKKYPKVEKGAVIKIGVKPIKEKSDKNENKNDINWREVVGDTITQMTAILSLILLVQNVN